MSRWVTNVGGSSVRSPRPTCGCPNHRAHYEYETGVDGHDCANEDCENLAEVGGHVWDLDGDRRQYLVPLCVPCNNMRPGAEFRIRSSVKLVYANSRHGGVKPGGLSWPVIAGAAAGVAFVAWIAGELTKPAPPPPPPLLG